MKKEEFIKNVLNSTQNIVQVEPRPAVLENIQLRIAKEKKETNYLKWSVAASIVFLVYLNVSLYKSTEYANENKTEISDLITTNNQLY